LASKVFGRHAVLALLGGPRRVHRVYVAHGVDQSLARELRAKAAARGVGVSEVSRSWLDERAADVTHQGVMAEAEPVRDHDLDEVLGEVAAGSEPFLIALDQVQDPHNLGAVMRTAAAAGAHGLIAQERRSAPLGPGAIKAAAGVAEWFPLIRVVNLARTLDAVKDRGLWVVGASPDAPELCWEADLRRPLALVVGGEDRGLRRLVREKCDMLVRLPMSTRVESLNASVAAGVLIYEVCRQRGEWR